LGQEALRRSEGVVADDIRTTVNVDGHNFSPVGWFDLSTDITLVYGIAALSSLLSRIAGLSSGHRVSPNGNAEHLERIVQILGKGLLDQMVLAVDVSDYCRHAIPLYYCYC
jgi:hypothetical protein